MLMSALIVLASATSPMPEAVTPPATLAHPVSQETCPVCGKAIPPGEGSRITVRGHEYSVDVRECGDELMANPDKFLEPDGTAKNAKK